MPELTLHDEDVPGGLRRLVRQLDLPPAPIHESYPCFQLSAILNDVTSEIPRQEKTMVKILLNVN